MLFFTEKVDARTLKPDVQEQLRHQAIRLRKSGRKYQEIADIIGIYPTTICKWFKRYEAEGLKGVKIQKRARRVGSCRTLKAERQEQVEVFYLPAYCPELNPDEYLNNDLKTGLYQGELARTQVQLRKKTISHLRMLQKQPLKVKKFFEHPKVAYSA